MRRREGVSFSRWYGSIRDLIIPNTLSMSMWRVGYEENLTVIETWERYQ